MQKHLYMATKRNRIRERDYGMEDVILIEHSRTLAELFRQNMADFTAFDFTLDNTFHSNWVAQANLCEDIETDETANDGLQQYTQDAVEARKTCFDAANGLKYYVEKAFPGNLYIAREFGFTERTKVRSKTFNTLMWFAVMPEIADYYMAELTAVSMPASIITDLNNAIADLANKEKAQEIYKRVIIRLQGQRVEQHNKLYAMDVRVNRAAHVIYRNEEEKRALFNLK